MEINTDRNRTVIFQASKSTVYAKELIHLRTCLMYMWNDRARKLWMNSCLINLFGKERAWKTDDEVNEDIIRERKAYIDHVIGPNDKHGSLIIRQIMTLRLFRKRIYKVSGTTKYFENSKLSSSKAHVETIAKEVTSSRVFQHDATVLGSREKCDGIDESLLHVAIDAWAEGCRRLLSGKPVSKYKATARGGWKQNTEYAEEDEDNDDSRDEGGDED